MSTSTFNDLDRKDTISHMCGVTMNDSVDARGIAEIMEEKPGIEVTNYPALIRMDAEGKMTFDMKELSEALGREFTAYDFVVYGGLEGVVEHIGADTVKDEEGNPFYEVLVRTSQSGIAEDKPIIPGMTVEVDILTGKKTILAYLMKPVLGSTKFTSMPATRCRCLS